MQSNDDLDRLLDEGLRGYVDAAPPVGMNERILRKTKARGLYYWTALAAAAALVGIWWAIPQPRTLSIALPDAPKAPEVVEQASVAAPVPSEPIRLRRPKPPIAVPFPTPTPLTSEERALLALARRGQSWQLANAKSPTAPIEIQPLDIEPLQKNERKDIE